MEFREKQAIYLQIADYVCEQILLNSWPPGGRIMSIRELGVYMEVTPNTIQRTYDFLQQKGIISNKRGVGYSVEEDGLERVVALRKEQFIENDLPLVFTNMYLLGISPEEMRQRFDHFVQQNFNPKKV